MNKTILAIEDLLNYFEVDNLEKVVLAIESLGTCYMLNKEYTNYQKGYLVMSYNDEDLMPEFKFITKKQTRTVPIEDVELLCYKAEDMVKKIIKR